MLSIMQYLPICHCLFNEEFSFDDETCIILLNADFVIVVWGGLIIFSSILIIPIYLEAISIKGDISVSVAPI